MRAAPPRVAHLVASPFFGGPERQLAGLARHQPQAERPVFLCLHERGLSAPFQEALAASGQRVRPLPPGATGLLALVREVERQLRAERIEVLCTHGYKPDVIGWLAARRAGVKVVGVSRGWTGATWRVRTWEALDRRLLGRLDHVVAVSHAQAAKVRRAGVPERRISVVQNAIDAGRFAHPDPAARQALLGLFPKAPSLVVAAAGRLSPEKAFHDLVEAARQVLARQPDAGFVLFGDGPLRAPLARQLQEAGLTGRFVLAGFRDDLDRLVPAADLFAQSSLTEGLPNVILEAAAAGVPVVATAVGGTPEVVQDGEGGLLVPPGQPDALAAGLSALLADRPRRLELGRRARHRVLAHFTFEAQAQAYRALFGGLVGRA